MLQRRVLTDVRALRDRPRVDLLLELRLVIVDVVQLDGELGLRLQLLSRPLVDHGGFEDVGGLLLPVQAAGGVEIPVVLIDDEDLASSLPRQNILDQAVAVVLVGLELQMDTHGTKSAVDGTLAAQLFCFAASGFCWSLTHLASVPLYLHKQTGRRHTQILQLFPLQILIMNTKPLSLEPTLPINYSACDKLLGAY